MPSMLVIMAARRHGGTAARRHGLLVTLALLALAWLLLSAPVGAQTTNDYDTDDNGLIEIDSLRKLSLLRHDLDGDGSSTDGLYVTYFANADSNQCPGGCQGYELAQDLDFDSNGNGEVTASDHSGAFWNGGAGWDPIGTNTAPYNARFSGNGHTLANLTINRSSGAYQGLFGGLGANARVERLALEDANITGQAVVGILAGVNYGVVSGAYATGQATATQEVGGIVGQLHGELRAVYSTAAVSGPSGRAGGLVGRTQGSAKITASYATGAANSGGLVGALDSANSAVAASYSTGAVSTSHRGGLIGSKHASAAVTNSYYDRQTSGRSDIGKGEPKTTGELQGPIRYTGLYEFWNVDVTGDSAPDDPWDFGSPRHYPALKVDFDGDGAATCREFGPQRCYTAPGPPPYNWRADHPEIYANARHGITAACEVVTTGEGDDAISTSTLTFDLAEYTRPITLALSLWDRTHFRSLPSLGIAMPELQRQGQTASVEVVTDPARTRFRLDGQYGLNLVLGYADCHTDDS